MIIFCVLFLGLVQFIGGLLAGSPGVCMCAERCSSETAVQSPESHLPSFCLLRNLLGTSPLPFISFGE
jgi:hypothetical protein